MNIAIFNALAVTLDSNNKQQSVDNAVAEINRLEKIANAPVPTPTPAPTPDPTPTPTTPTTTPTPNPVPVPTPTPVPVQKTGFWQVLSNWLKAFFKE